MDRAMKEQQAHHHVGYLYQPGRLHLDRFSAPEAIDLDDINDEPGLRTVFIPAPASPDKAGRPRTVVRVTHHGKRGVPPRARATSERHTQEDVTPTTSSAPVTQPVRRVPRRRWHWLTYIGVPLLLMVAGFIIISTAHSWWQSWQDDMRYGRPRTYQTDAHVGHGDNITPSHFIAVNLHGRILVTEIAGADPTRSKIYVGPDIGDPDIPVTLEFRDVGGDQRPDMLIKVNKKAYVFINDTIDEKPQFRPPKEGETVNQ